MQIAARCAASHQEDADAVAARVRDKAGYYKLGAEEEAHVHLGEAQGALAARTSRWAGSAMVASLHGFAPSTSPLNLAPSAHSHMPDSSAITPGS